MKNIKIKSSLKNVPQTMLIPLRARYLETKKPDGIIYDPKSVEMLDRIECDFSGKKEVSRGTQTGVSIRTEILDELTVNFISKHDDAVVINLGCGLDTRFHRLDNGTVTWFDLDVAEAIDLRSNFFSETERFRFIPSSVLEFSWIDMIPKDHPVLFIAEGLLMYFTESEVKSILKTIKVNFPYAEMILEAMSPFIAKRTNRHPDMKGYNAQFKWGIKTGKEIDAWNAGATFITEYYYFDRHKDKQPAVLRFLALFPGFRKMMKIIHLRF
ncbi:MAG: class I SAM-dependent methyltransferase [Deltaproteobacteria bacterium]|nr:class I SAM-dependent methyltransferase [Deltaproteobacteria bacterium]